MVDCRSCLWIRGGCGWLRRGLGSIDEILRLLTDDESISRVVAVSMILVEAPSASAEDRSKGSSFKLT